MMKHTPGPWKTTKIVVTSNYECTFPPGDYYHVMAQTHPLRWDSVAEFAANEADARLIAAAPELLDAVKTLLRGFDEGVFVRDIMHDCDSGWAMKLLPFVMALQKAQAAIAKAEGRGA